MGKKNAWAGGSIFGMEYSIKSVSKEECEDLFIEYKYEEIFNGQYFIPF